MADGAPDAERWRVGNLDDRHSLMQTPGTLPEAKRGDPDAMITIAEFCTWQEIDPTTFYRRTKRGGVPGHIRIGRHSQRVHVRTFLQKSLVSV